MGFNEQLTVIVIVVFILLIGATIFWFWSNRDKIKKQSINTVRKNIIEIVSPEVKKKKEKARELYYKRLYEEVTKFNISTENLDYEGLQLLADSHGKIGNKLEASRLYDLAFERAENSEKGFDKATILKDKAFTLFNFGAYDEVIDTLREYSNEDLNKDIDQNDFSAVSMLGNSFFRLNQFDAAIETFRRAVDSRHVSTHIIYDLAKSFEAKNTDSSLRQALKHYLRVMELDKTFQNVKDKVEDLEARFLE